MTKIARLIIGRPIGDKGKQGARLIKQAGDSILAFRLKVVIDADGNIG